jgi:CBS domain-containing protein
METGVKVIDAMTKAPIVVDPKESIIVCAKLMLEKGVGSLLVKKNDVLLGILTEKDLVDKIIAKKIDPSNTFVEKIMTKTEMVTISPNEDLHYAMLLMSRENKRRLPVVDNGKIMGLLTYKDVLKIQPDLYDLFVEKFKMEKSKDA